MGECVRGVGEGGCEGCGCPLQITWKFVLHFFSSEGVSAAKKPEEDQCFSSLRSVLHFAEQTGRGQAPGGPRDIFSTGPPQRAAERSEESKLETMWVQHSPPPSLLTPHPSLFIPHTATDISDLNMEASQLAPQLASLQDKSHSLSAELRRVQKEVIVRQAKAEREARSGLADLQMELIKLRRELEVIGN